MHRGEIWWARLPKPRASEPGYRRPILIIQSDSFNVTRISTIVAIVLTSNMMLGRAPGNVALPKKETGLPKDSVANVSQILTLDKSFLTECIGILPEFFFRKVEAGLRLVLDL